MFRLQRELLNREYAAHSAYTTNSGAAGGGVEASRLYRGTSSGQHQHPSFSSLVGHQTRSYSGSPGSSSPPLKPADAPGTLAAGTIVEASLKRAISGNCHQDTDGGLQLQGLSAAMMAARRNSLLGAASLTLSGTNDHNPNATKRQRLSLGYPSSPGSASISIAQTRQPQQQHRGSKAKLRDDFWGKVGKNNSHIHLVNIVLGRLLHVQVQKAKVGNKVLSNGLIQQILDNKLYGKYVVRDFFASSNKGSETVRNTWTRLNFSNDDIREGLSRYKEQTWQAIERCSFEEPNTEDEAEMEAALKIFAQTRRFVNALDVALKGIITEQFMGVLMQLRLEWNSICLNCRPEDHDTVVSTFLRKYGLNGK